SPSQRPPRGPAEAGSRLSALGRAPAARAQRRVRPWVPSPYGRRACRLGPALMFRNTGTSFPLVAGLYATRRRALLAFEATETSIDDKVLKGINNPIGSVDFKGPPPCQDVVLTGDQIDVTKLPVPTYSPKDGGPYITPASWSRRILKR